MNDAQTSSLPQRRSRAQLWLVAALFFTPLAISFLLYYGGGWRPAESTNRGDLIDPIRTLPEAVLATPEGGTTAPDFLRGKWSIVYAGSGCDDHCRKALVDGRQVRTALNQDSKRVQRVFLYSGPCCEQGYFAMEHPGLIMASIDDAAGGELLQAFPAYDGIPALVADRLYVVDPLGNLLLSYAPDAPPKGLLDDLKKLLRLSQIG